MWRDGVPMTNRPDHSDDGHDDFGGLARDLGALVGRRRMLALLGGVGAAGVLAACGGSSASSTTTPTTTGATSTSAAATSTTAAATGGPGGQPPTGGPGGGMSGSSDDADGETPTETNGPYPADGTNGPNVLTSEGIERRDIASSFGEYTGSADGVPITYEFTVLDNATGEPLAGHAFYLWHCTAAGQYSLYEVTDQNYLRGLQVTDADGKVTFTSIFPGCYAGRWPHTHFEVYESPDTATAGSAALKISQSAFPQSDCETVYADSRYGNSASNLGQLSLATDNIFSDGYDTQLATMSGSPSAGYTHTLDVRI